MGAAKHSADNKSDHPAALVSAESVRIMRAEHQPLVKSAYSVLTEPGKRGIRKSSHVEPDYFRDTGSIDPANLRTCRRHDRLFVARVFDHPWRNPPSTVKIEPVMYFARSLSRKTASS